MFLSPWFLQLGAEGRLHTALNVGPRTIESLVGRYANNFTPALSDTLKKPKSKRKEDREILLFQVSLPEFPGGAASLQEFIKTHLIYPEDAKAARIEGKVYVQFIVEEDGHLSDIHVVRGLYPSCDEEALRLVKTLPKWKPKTDQGKAIPARFTIHVIFKLP